MIVISAVGNSDIKKKMEQGVSNLVNILKMVAVLVAALILGNWFLAELKKAHRQGAPWYQPYLSTPGVLILLALMLPVLVWIIRG